tara:strand:+ start:576 stop:1925 length:1350 start_codon:yes stop_codon:yes gene_type:complete
MAINLEESDNFIGGAVVGTGLLGAAGYKMASSIPGGPAKMLADYSHNFLEGFYDKGATATTRATLAGKEGIKSLGRMTKSAINPIESLTYRRTGISPLVVDFYNKSEADIEEIKRRYIKGDIKYEPAKNQIRNIEKQMHFKLTNDYSNAYMYRQKPTGPLANYASKYVSEGSASDFIKTAGKDVEVAKYAISRQPGVGYLDKAGHLQVDWDKVKLMKYKNVNFSDVTRGAQFDPKFFRTMRLLKGHSSAENALLAVERGMTKGTNATITGGKVVFNLSPSIRPNYDWGGFNAVGVWDPKHKTKIRIMATDKRDLFGVKLGGLDTVNYVESKQIEIADLKKEVERKPAVKRKSGYTRGPYKTRISREEKAKTLRLNKGKIGQDIGDKIIKPYNKAYSKNVKILKNPNLFNPAGRKALMKMAPSILRRMGLVGGAASLALSLAALMRQDEY